MNSQSSTLASLRASADDLTRELERLPEAQTLWRTAEGEWSQHECLTHIQIVERHIFLPRVRAIATQENPPLPVIDERALMQAEWNPQRPRADLLADFLSARAEEIALLEAHDWARPGVHATRGPITLGWVAEYALGHTWEHMSQMMRVRLAYEVRKA
jgi:hypothetical protein